MAERAPTAASSACTRLRTEILDGELAAGATLYEVEQAERLGVSRTPVREAFRRLVADGLAEDRGGRGLVVTEVSDRDVDSLFQFRAGLEAQAGQLAAARAEPDTFHNFARAFRDAHPVLSDPGLDSEQIAEYFALIRRFDVAVNEAAGNPYLVGALENLRTHVARVRRRAGQSPERLAATALEHALIATAIADRDASLVVHATHVHIHNSLAHVRAAIAEAPSTDGSDTDASSVEERTV